MESYAVAKKKIGKKIHIIMFLQYKKYKTVGFCGSLQQQISNFTKSN